MKNNARLMARSTRACNSPVVNPAAGSVHQCSTSSEFWRSAPCVCARCGPMWHVAPSGARAPELLRLVAAERAGQLVGVVHVRQVQRVPPPQVAAQAEVHVLDHRVGLPAARVVNGLYGSRSGGSSGLTWCTTRGRGRGESFWGLYRGVDLAAQLVCLGSTWCWIEGSVPPCLRWRRSRCAQSDCPGVA